MTSAPIKAKDEREKREKKIVLNDDDRCVV